MGIRAKISSVVVISILFTGGLAYAQSVLRVNNTPGVNTPYTTLAAAITAAGVNDVIMVEGSMINYGDVVITKKVKIVGPGYMLTDNIGKQASVHPATINSITLNAGSSSSSFYGLTLSHPSTYAMTMNGVSNIEIAHCLFPDFYGIAMNGTGANISIRSNLFTRAAQVPYALSCGGTYSSVLLANNYFSEMVDVGMTSVFTITNNIFQMWSNDIRNSFIRNNVFFNGINFSIVNATGSVIQYNVFVVPGQSGADGTNIFNAPIASIFIDYTMPGSAGDTRWMLKAGSPAIGAGEAGIDCGMYGGATPYRPSGIRTGQHTITNLAVPSTIPQNGTLNVQVNAKVH